MLYGGQILERDVDMDKHVGVPGCPVSGIGTLRELVPNHSGAGILIFGDKGERLPSPLVVAAAHQCIDGNKGIPGKEPGVLGTASISGRAITSNQTAAQNFIAYPGLIQGDLRPGELLVQGMIGSFDPQRAGEQLLIVTACL